MDGLSRQASLYLDLVVFESILEPNMNLNVRVLSQLVHISLFVFYFFVNGLFNTSKVFWTKPMPFCGKIVIAKLPGSSFFTEIICCLFLIANGKMPKL